MPRATLRMILAMTFLALIAGFAAPAAYAETAKGYVFNDRNGDGQRNSGEDGIAGVYVSNSVQVVATNDDGYYELPVEGDTSLFVIKPTGWRTGVSEYNLPRFYYIHKPDGSPESDPPGVPATGPLPAHIDFGLQRQEEPDEFRVIFFGDPQPYSVEEVNYVAHDVVTELIGFDAAFGVTLGDIVGDNLELFDLLNGVVGQIGVPWYNVIGNHDLNFDTTDDTLSDETFERVYGPSYYAYNYADVHFIVIDDVLWKGRGYDGLVGEKQLEFIRNDLATVPKDRLVVLMMHIPLPSVNDRDKLLELIEDRPHSFSIAAHWHRQGSYFMESGDNSNMLGDHHHLVHGTVSGSWWNGQPDEFGIPHTLMSDGTPNGYSIATFRGNKYSLRYKAARRPAEFQMTIDAPDEVIASDAGQHEVIVNVFMGSSKSTVEMRIGNGSEWTAMEHVDRADPYYARLKDREKYYPPITGDRLPDIRNSTHLWAAPLPSNLPKGTHTIHIQTTDIFGETHKGHRIIRVL